MSAWEDLDPEQQRRRSLADPVAAPRLIAADRRLILAMAANPIDLKGLDAALKDQASPDRVVVNGFPALHVAVHKRDLKALDLLLDHGARKDDWDAQGATALDLALRQNFVAGAKKLKFHGAETRLVRSAGDDDPEDVSAPAYTLRMNTHLKTMILRGTVEQVEQAIALGADVSAAPVPGETRGALHHAVAQMDLGKVSALLDAGADVFARTVRGEEVIDVLWQAPPRDLFSDSWNEMFELLHRRGYANLFVRHPSQMTLDDLRQPFPDGQKDAPSLMHYLVRCGHADVVLDVLKRNPADRLTAADMLKVNARYRKTLLDAFAESGTIADAFTADVWQDRLEEMLSLKSHVDKAFPSIRKVDFDKAAADVRARRLQTLRQKAPRLKLKPN